MRSMRSSLMVPFVCAVAVLAVVGSMLFLTTSSTARASVATVQSLISSQGTAPWSERNLTGSTVLAGQVPLAVTTSAARYVGPHAKDDVLRLNFSLPLRDR